MNRIQESNDGALGGLSSGARALGAAALMAVAGGVAERAEAATTWDAPQALTDINTSTVHELCAAPDSSGNLLYTSTADDITTTQKVLLNGASAPSDVSATGLSSYTSLAGAQPTGPDSFVVYDYDTSDIVKVTDTSGGGYSSGSIATPYSVVPSGNVAVDSISGDMAYSEWDSREGLNIVMEDGTPLVDGAGDQWAPSLDSTHNRVFYVEEGSGGTLEVHVKDLSTGTSEKVVDGTSPYYDQAKQTLYYAALNGSTYDAYSMKETTFVVTDPDKDVDGSPASVDCDDDDATVHPGATEVCDDKDNDCDGSIDGAATPVDAPIWYEDNDGDGMGSTVQARACEMPTGYADNDDDPDDGDPLNVPKYCEEGEDSSEGEFEAGEVICGEGDAEARVGGGTVGYTVDGIIEAYDEGDWLQVQGDFSIDAEPYIGLNVSTSPDFSGGFGLGVEEGAMVLASMLPPPDDGTEARFATLVVKNGTATMNSEGETWTVQPGTYVLEDADPDTDTDTDSDSDTDTDSDTDSDSDTDTDTDTNSETGEDTGTPEETDTDDDGRGCNSCSSNGSTDLSGILGVSALVAAGLRRRRKAS